MAQFIKKNIVQLFLTLKKNKLFNVGLLHIISNESAFQTSGHEFESFKPNNQ